jgi:hypothetical protein
MRRRRCSSISCADEGRAAARWPKQMRFRPGGWPRLRTDNRRERITGVLMGGCASWPDRSGACACHLERSRGWSSRGSLAVRMGRMEALRAEPSRASRYRLVTARVQPMVLVVAVEDLRRSEISALSEGAVHGGVEIRNLRHHVAVRPLASPSQASLRRGLPDPGVRGAIHDCRRRTESPRRSHRCCPSRYPTPLRERGNGAIAIAEHPAQPHRSAGRSCSDAPL